jgi:chromosome segregation ATPase
MNPAPGINAAMEMATETSSIPSKPKPSIPQKKNHVHELVRLKKELAEVQDARDMMEVEILKLQEDVEEKDKQLNELSQELWTWKDRAESWILPTLTAQERSPKDVDRASETELAQARQEIQRLTAALAESEATIRQHTSATSVTQSSNPASEDEFRARFESEFAKAQEQWRTQVNQENKLRVAAEGSLHSTREYYENKMKEVEQQAQTRIAEQQRLAQEAKSSSLPSASSQPMEIDSVDTGEIEALRDKVNDLENRIKEQHQCTEQYRRMSERLTTQVKQADMARRTAEQSEQTLRRQLEDSRPQRHTPQRHQQVPGSFR